MNLVSVLKRLLPIGRGLFLAGILAGEFTSGWWAAAQEDSIDAGSVKSPFFDPIVQGVEGWTVHLDPALLEGEFKPLGDRAIRMLADHLHRISILVPEEPLKKMRQLEIWLERDHPSLKSMQYHPSREWLVDHGHDPRLAKKVHITQAADLLSRQQLLKHPMVVLHELAHAYHDQVLGFDEPSIRDAYEKAKAAGIYENVLLYTGKYVQHYGLTNHKEYFAEATEAYFYRNDFYPFVAGELMEHDPMVYDLLKKIWEGKEKY